MPDPALHDLGGPGDATAPALLLCHANGFCGGVWRPLAERLVDTYRCVALDFRGHGLTPQPPGGEADWSGFGDDVEAALDSELLAAARVVHGVGHSLGGGALVLAAARRPGAFRSLWLYEPIAPPPDGFPARPGGSPNPLVEVTLRRRTTFASAEAAVANFASKPPLDRLHPDALRAYVECGFEPRDDGSVRLRCAPGWEAAIYASGNRNPAWANLSLVTVPTAVAVGRVEGPFGPSTFAARVAEELPHGRLVRHPELGHFGPLEDPDAIATDLRAWLAGG
jgi:pimeloyl-ACP methyl ester carboxylesterase